MIRVVDLHIALGTAAAFEVSMALHMRELQEYDALDQPHQKVKFLQIFKAGSQWMGVFWVTPIKQPHEPIAQQPLRTPAVEPRTVPPMTDLEKKGNC